MRDTERGRGEGIKVSRRYAIAYLDIFLSAATAAAVVHAICRLSVSLHMHKRTRRMRTVDGTAAFRKKLSVNIPRPARV